MSFMTTDMMPSSHPSWELAYGPDQTRPGRMAPQQDLGGRRSHHSVNRVPRTYHDHREPRSYHRMRRLGDFEVGDGVDDCRSSRGSSHDFHSVQTEPSESSRGMRGREMVRQPIGGRGNSHRPPPLEEFGSSSGGRSNRHPSYGFEQRGHDLRGFGSWCEPTTAPHQRFQIEAFRTKEEASESRWQSTPKAPSTPRERLLPAPDLPPMSTHFAFCTCCGDEEEADRINDTWYMAGKDKMDTQLEHAMAYIATMKSESDH